jgi:hypothetical protein
MSASKLQRLAEAAETGPTRYLTYDGLIETVGSDTVLDDVTNLEILFLTFDEIADSSKGVKSVFQHVRVILAVNETTRFLSREKNFIRLIAV